MQQNYLHMFPMRPHILDPLIEAARNPNFRKVLWNNNLEEAFDKDQVNGLF